MSNNIEKKCSICGSDYADRYFKEKYTDKLICEDCLLNLDEVEKSVAIINYFVDGEYVGNDDEPDELYKSLCDYLDYEEVEDD